MAKELMNCEECRGDGGISYGGGREARCGACGGTGKVAPLCECGNELYSKIDLESEMCPYCREVECEYLSSCGDVVDDDIGICMTCKEHSEGLNEWEETLEDVRHACDEREVAV